MVPRHVQDRQTPCRVSASTAAVFHTQVDPLLSQESRQHDENSQDVDSSPNEPTLSTIMLAIQDCKDSLFNQIASIRMDFALLKQDVQNLCDKTLSSFWKTLNPLSVNMHITTSEMAALHAKNDLENRSRWNNLHFFDFPE